MGRIRVAVLASGAGSLLQAILDGRDERYEVCVVLSDRPGVRALDRARDAGVPAVVVDWKDHGKDRRPAFSSACARVVVEHGSDLNCSAGFGRILSPNWFDETGVPYINSHPALLPSFPGPHGVRDALDYGVKVTGTTFIFADDSVDGGPVIWQEAVPVEPGDTEESLHERIKAVEQRLYPQVIRLFAEGRIKREGRRVHVLDEGIQ